MTPLLNPSHQRRFLEGLRRVLPVGACLVDSAARAVYSRDASHLTLGQPLAVVLPQTADQVAAVVRLCAGHAVPFVARGAGTGLSGGAVPPAGAVVISLARLTGAGPVDPQARTIRVETGVINEQVSRLVASCGLQFAPDPGSQSASTIGGNIAENAGGPHTLKVGVTLHHVRRLEWIDPQGSGWTTGRGAACERGIDLATLLIGSEGTLGIVTAAELALVPRPQGWATLLAVFPELNRATHAVIELLAAGLLPAAIEMVDRAMLAIVEEAFHFGFPTDADAVMIVELDGQPEAVAEDADRAQALLRSAGASTVQRAGDETERLQLWTCRKKAFGAVGRLAPCYVSMDVVVPLPQLPAMMRAIQEIAREQDVRVAAAFHAGDGNVHPGVLYDDRDPELTARAYRAADTITEQALQFGGSCTGEHGVGLEKLHLVGRQIDRTAAELMGGLARLCDADSLCNPGKAIPQGTQGLGPPPRLPDRITFQWDGLTVTAPAEADWSEIQTAALRRGFWVPLGAVRPATAGWGLGTAGQAGDLVDHLLGGPSLLGKGSARDFLLEVWAETGDGRLFHAGAPVGKNVAGYGLVPLLAGSGGVLARLRAVTFQLKPIPEVAAIWSLAGPPQAVDGQALWSLLEELASWPADLSAPVCIVESTEGQEFLMTVLASGRDRPWDLGRKEATLAAWGTQCGLARRDSQRVAFADLARLADNRYLPAWSRASGDWTVWARLPGGPLWPDFLAASRMIWQAVPPLFWTPTAQPVDGWSGAAQTPDNAPGRRSRAGMSSGQDGWYADTIILAGSRTDLPAPGPGLPTHLLAGLKNLFDPDRQLPEPPWLGQARTGKAPEVQP